MSLAQAVLTVAGQQPGGLRLTFGVVTDDSPFLVQIEGASTGTPAYRLTSYTPTVGDKVAVVVTGDMRIVLGETA